MSYFDYFEMTQALTSGPDGSGFYSTAEVDKFYLAQASEENTYITFTEYPPSGWIGYCTSPDCDGGETAPR